jgi:hypothetical protein
VNISVYVNGGEVPEAELGKIYLTQNRNVRELIGRVNLRENSQEYKARAVPPRRTSGGK